MSEEFARPDQSAEVGAATKQQRPNSNSARNCSGRPTLADAVGRADLHWWACAMSALKTEARTGRRFGADTLSEVYGLADPDSPNRWGALFSAAAKAGLIDPVGFRISRRTSRSGGVCREWCGVRR